MAIGPMPGSDTILEGARRPRAGTARLHRRIAAAWRASSLHSLLQVLAMCGRRGDLAKAIAYVWLSLGAALASSLAAIGLVPLMQPGLSAWSTLPFAWHGIESQAVAFAAAMIAFALMRWQAARLGAALVSQAGMSLRQRVHAHMVDASLAELADATSAEIAHVLTHNIETLVQGFSALLQLATVGLTAVVSLAFAFWVSPALMYVSPLLVLMAVLAARAYGREQSAVSRRYVADMTRLFWFSEEFPRRLRHVRSFERQSAEKAGYGAISAQLALGYRRQLELVAGGRLLLELLAALGIAGTFFLAHRWHGMDSAAMIAVGLLLGRLLPYLVSTRQAFQQLRSAEPALALWRRYVALDQDDGAQLPARAMVLGDTLQVDYVRLHVPSGLEVPVLILVPGEMTLIAGDSGIGKSSLVDVLAGMVRPTAFIARLGAQPIDFDAYRALVRNGAYIGQGVRPWQSTVRDCLLWAEPRASDDALRRALADVGLDRRLATSGEDLDTALHTSGRLSGGEMQRLLLAQVILRQPALAILDEATNALDASAEIAVLSVLKRRLPRTILVVVSHRPALAVLADRHVQLGEPAQT